MSGEPRWLNEEEQEHWRAYLRGFRAVQAALDRDIQEHGVSLAEYEILSMLSEQPEHRMRMSGLAELCVQSRSRMTHTATRLEGRGWVVREPCADDRRGVELVLTPDGLAKVGELAASHVESVRQHLVDLLTPAEFAALGEAMAKIEATVRPRVTMSGARTGASAS